MRRALVIATFVFAPLGVMAATAPAGTHDSDTGCNVRLRKKFEKQCGKATSQWQPLGAVAYVSGVGFFDIPHTQNPTRGTSRSSTRSPG